MDGEIVSKISKTGNRMERTGRRVGKGYPRSLSSPVAIRSGREAKIVRGKIGTF